MRKTLLVIIGLLFALSGTVSWAENGGQGTDVVDFYTGQVIHHRPFPRKSSVKTLKDPQTGVEVTHEEVKTHETNGEWRDPETGQTIREKAIDR
ncbi:MAG: hypothetical protein HY788_03075 [Deltaproteobacteria bacterium]|nr:hypothetical protein [Deltaproteobacteria bacterium]